MKSHNISIDILKFFAALLITNSHMELLYGKYSMLATGGSIGDVLFFFASGFTLFLGRMGRFDNWYKRRIKPYLSYCFCVGYPFLFCVRLSKRHEIHCHSWRGMVRYLHNDVLHHFMDYQTNNRKQVRMGICRCFGSSVG